MPPPNERARAETLTRVPTTPDACIRCFSITSNCGPGNGKLAGCLTKSGLICCNTTHARTSADGSFLPIVRGRFTRLSAARVGLRDLFFVEEGKERTERNSFRKLLTIRESTTLACLGLATRESYRSSHTFRLITPYLWANLLLKLRPIQCFIPRLKLLLSLTKRESARNV